MKRPVAFVALASFVLAGPLAQLSPQLGSQLSPQLGPQLVWAQSGAAAPAAGPTAAASERSKELKAEGDRAIGEMRYTEALAAYQKAYEADPTWEVLFNRGRAYQFLGRNPEALADFERFAREAPADVRAKVPGIEKIAAEVRLKVAYITVRSSVTGATVVLGDRVLGTVPLGKRIGVNRGTFVLKATAPGYETYERPVELEGSGKELQIDIVMAAVGDGLLRIESGTPGAIAFVDGRKMGVTPIEVPVAPGDHQVALEAEDFEPGEQRARVDAGRSKLVRFDLVPVPEVYETWWFWTGVGLVVAGGVATAIIVTRETDPPNGDFSPGQVSVAGRPVFSF